MENVCEQPFFRSCNRFSVGFRSELWPGHSNTIIIIIILFKLFHFSPGFIFRVVVLLEGESSPQSPVFYRFQQVFSQDIPSFSSTHLLINSDHLPLPAEKHLQSTKLPPCLTVRMVCSQWCAVWVFCHTQHFALRPKSSILVSPNKSAFFHLSAVSSTWILENCKRDFLWLSSCHSIKARCEKHMTNSCPVDRLPQLSCGSLQFVRHVGPLGRASDQCSPCSARKFRWTAVSLVRLPLCHTLSISGWLIERCSLRCSKLVKSFYSLTLL